MNRPACCFRGYVEEVCTIPCAIAFHTEPALKPTQALEHQAQTKKVESERPVRKRLESETLPVRPGPCPSPLQD